MRYFARGFFNRHHFDARVWKVSVDAGTDCPNRDGRVGSGGCVFCNPASFSPSRRSAATTITAQLEEGVERMRRRYKAEKFIAYFQPGTNTNASVERLSQLFAEALSHENVVGLAIGTRPDCLGDDVVDLLSDLAQSTWLSLELGLQSIHERSLRWMNRGHGYDTFLDAIARCEGRGFEIGAHVILGLPGESRDDMAATARELARVGINAVKLHNLHAVKNTPLAKMVADGDVTFPSLGEYVGWTVDFLELLPPTCVIDRLSGDAPPEFLLGPAWCSDKAAARQAVDEEFQRRDSWQGKHWKPSEP